MASILIVAGYLQVEKWRGRIVVRDEAVEAFMKLRNAVGARAV